MGKTRKLQHSDWRIVIPSYKREETLQKKSLATLAEYNIPEDKIYIVVADEVPAPAHHRSQQQTLVSRNGDRSTISE